MLLSLVASLALGTSLADLKLERSKFDYLIASSVANGLEGSPVVRWMLPTTMPELSGADKAALTREALTQVKAFLETADGQKQWAAYLGPDAYFQSVPERSAGIAADFAYWSTLVKERKPSLPKDAEQLARVTARQNAFKAEKPRLEKEAATRAKAAAAPEPASLNLQLKERLTYFIAETKQMSWDAKTEEKNGKKRFVSATLEGKPNWWKFCWRAGPEATNAAREFATGWLAELNAPPSKLSDDK